MKIFILLIFLFISKTSQKQIDKKDLNPSFILFQDFIKIYNKTYYSLEEFIIRWEIFNMNLLKPSIAKGRWKEGITKFSDLTPEEFKFFYRNNIKRNKLSSLKIHKIAMHKNFTKINKTNELIIYFNWVDMGVVPEIKDQYSCGANWAFSLCGNLECQYLLKHDEFMSCSEQNLIDCDTSGNGCSYSDEKEGALWLKRNGGVMKEEDYPYIEDEGICHQNESFFGIKVNDLYQMVGNDEDDMRDFLLMHGPSIVALNGECLQFYKRGIISADEFECNPRDIDISAVLVGFGTINDMDYWIIRNSWGKNWGENGYFRIQRRTNTCGINTEIFTMGVE